jgi:hypothetical protein
MYVDAVCLTQDSAIVEIGRKGDSKKLNSGAEQLARWRKIE